MQNEVKVLGIDVAKNVFQIHGVDASGKEVFRQKLSRAKLKPFMATQSKCLVGMEACGGAHHWAREFQTLGHEVKLMAPQYVKPYVKRNKNDEADAAAIAEAVTRPGMNFVAVKEVWQQDILMVHRVRERLVKQRTALMNEIRGLMQEYGVVMATGPHRLRQGMVNLLASTNGCLTEMARGILEQLVTKWREMDERLATYTKRLEQMARSHELCRELDKLPGIGPITATAMVATIGNPRVFRNGRQLAAYLGLVPRHEGTGGKVRLLGISKRGDRYLRKLLIHGGRALLRHVERRSDRQSRWALAVINRRGFNKACVAMANKNARMCWAIMMKCLNGETPTTEAPPRHKTYAA